MGSNKNGTIAFKIFDNKYTEDLFNKLIGITNIDHQVKS